MKTFFEQKYPVSIWVKVEWNDTGAYYDSIKGLNIGHALYLARKNWEGAEIAFIAREK